MSQWTRTRRCGVNLTEGTAGRDDLLCHCPPYPSAPRARLCLTHTKPSPASRHFQYCCIIPCLSLSVFITEEVIKI